MPIECAFQLGIVVPLWNGGKYKNLIIYHEGTRENG
jgi:hypothetical protein